MLLTKYKSVPSGMSFVFDTGPSPRFAYLVSTPGQAAVVTVQGTGTWSVEILSSVDGVNFDVLATKSLPGQWRYDTLTANAVAVRVSAYSSGLITGMLTHGGAAPISNTSGLFGAFLIFSYNSTTTEPPTGNQIRFNSTSMPAVTKVWIRNTTIDGTDQWWALRKLPNGGTLLVQDRDDHAHAVLLSIVGPPIDKTAYVEVPVVYKEHIGALVSAQTLVGSFNPGPNLTLVPLTSQQLPYHPREAPMLTALDPPAAPLATPSFTLRVLGAGFAGDDVILWNDSPEPTTFVSDSELTTGVNMETAAVVMPIPVAVVTTEDRVSNELVFDLGGFPPVGYTAPPPTLLAARAESDSPPTEVERSESAPDQESEPEPKPRRKVRE